jgi:hypothetical protein
VLAVRMSHDELNVEESITSPLTMTQPSSPAAPSERPPFPNFGSPRGSPSVDAAALRSSSPVVASQDNDHCESLGTMLSLPGDGGRQARGCQQGGCQQEQLYEKHRYEGAMKESAVPPAPIVKQCRDMRVDDWKSLQQRSDAASFHRAMSDLVLAMNAKRGDESQDLWLPPILGDDATIRLPR